MSRPPKPCRPGDLIEVTCWMFPSCEDEHLDRHRRKMATSRDTARHPSREACTFTTTAGEIRWDSHLWGGTWAVDLPPNRHTGRAAAHQIRVLEPAGQPEQLDILDALDGGVPQ